MGPGQDQTIEWDTPFSILQLSQDRSNWITFKTCFLYAMGGCDIEGHFNGSEKTPTQPTFSSLDEKRWTMMDKELNEAYLAETRRWQCNKKVVHAQLAQVMSDSLLIHIQYATTVADMWKTMVTEFNKKGQMIQIDLHCKMMEKRAADSDDIRAYLDEIALMHEFLSSMGAALHDDDYASMILMCEGDTMTMPLLQPEILQKR